MTRSLVIGGTSLIGRPMVETLLAQGHEVTVLHRGRGTPFGDRVREIQGDRNDDASVRAAVGDDRFDIVFDNVYDFGKGTTAAQVEGTVEILRHDGLQRYVFMSSVAVYPEGEDGAPPCDEDDEFVPVSHPNLYAVHKAESERALFRLAESSGLPLTTIRPAFVYGPHNPFDREAFFWDRLRAGRPILIPGDGSSLMQWVHAEDVAGATVRAATAEDALGQAFNLAGPPLSQLDYSAGSPAWSRSWCSSHESASSPPGVVYWSRPSTSASTWTSRRSRCRGHGSSGYCGSSYGTWRTGCGRPTPGTVSRTARPRMRFGRTACWGLSGPAEWPCHPGGGPTRRGRPPGLGPSDDWTLLERLQEEDQPPPVFGGERLEGRP